MEDPEDDRPPVADVEAALGMVAVDEDIKEEERETMLSELSEELLTLVKIAGLNVHLKIIIINYGTGQENYCTKFKLYTVLL